jgi:hypothetical protein
MVDFIIGRVEALELNVGIVGKSLLHISKAPGTKVQVQLVRAYWHSC